MNKRTSIIMLSSLGNARMANKISKEIIEKKLASCIYLQEMKSISVKGKGKEEVAIIKTNLKCKQKILDLIGKYKVPEFIVFKAVDGWKPYLRYLEGFGKWQDV